MTATAEHYYGHSKASAAVSAYRASVAASAARFEQTRAFVDYHYRKLMDPSLHRDSWGGARNNKFSDREQLTFEVRCCVELQLFRCVAHRSVVSAVPVRGA